MEKIKTIAEYQQLASRTCVDLGSDEANLLHMNMGIDTEIGEFLDVIKKNLAYGKPLDVVNMGEEIADAAWYIMNKSRLFYTAPMEEVLAKNSYEDTRKEFEQIHALLFTKDTSKIKKTCLLLKVISPDEEDYQISFTKEAFEGVKDMVILQHVAEMWDIDFFQVLTNNINKLKVRYPEKFTEENAINRDLDSEREALEK